jgi:hypothetical protein
VCSDDGQKCRAFAFENLLMAYLSRLETQNVFSFFLAPASRKGLNESDHPF